MKAYDIICYAPINATDETKVREIADSILANGWTGMPILVDEPHGRLVTGSHRLAALKLIEDDIDLDDLGDIAEDVSDIIDAWCEANGGTLDDIDYSNLGYVFSGSWVEDYKDELDEW